MESTLVKPFEKLEQERQDLLNLVKDKSHEQQNFKPGYGKWSMLDVCHHLITAEKNTVIYLNKKFKGVDKTPKAGIGASIRKMILTASLGLPLRFKAPKAAQTKDVQPDYDYVATVDLWNETRAELKEFVDRLEKKHVGKLLFKHPFAGRLNIPQTLSFMQSHIAHHQEQVKRILNHPDFPKK